MTFWFPDLLLQYPVRSPLEPVEYTVDDRGITDWPWDIYNGMDTTFTISWQGSENYIEGGLMVEFDLKGFIEILFTLHPTLKLTQFTTATFNLSTGEHIVHSMIKDDDYRGDEVNQFVWDLIPTLNDNNRAVVSAQDITLDREEGPHTNPFWHHLFTSVCILPEFLGYYRHHTGVELTLDQLNLEDFVRSYIDVPIEVKVPPKRTS